MSPERQLAELVAHPWTEYRQGDKTYYGATCQVAYATKVNQLAAICDLHRCTPLTKEIIELNGFEKGPCSEYCHSYRIECGYFLWFHKNDAPLLILSSIITNEDATLFQIDSVADLENLLDLLGIDKQIKLPKPKKETDMEERMNRL